MSRDRPKAERFLAHLEPLQGALEAYCRRNVNDSHGVEDVLQSAIGKAYRDFGLYREGTNFRAWIFRYVNFETLNWNRANAATRREGDRNASVNTSWSQYVEEALFDGLCDRPRQVLEYCDSAVAEAVGRLRPIERSALLLRAIGEFKYDEIAQILDIPVGTVMSHLGRARARLRTQLEAYSREHGVPRREQRSQSGGRSVR